MSRCAVNPVSGSLGTLLDAFAQPALRNPGRAPTYRSALRDLAKAGTFLRRR
jgi:hypothetical protein